MKTWFRMNGLSATVLSIFIVLLIGQTLTGWQSYNDELRQSGAAELSLTEYLGNGHFGEATSENWESEFLQMAAYVLLTVFLRQKGSAESKSFSDEEPVDRDPRLDRHKTEAPFPVRRGGWLLSVYEYSLTLAFLLLFLLAFAWHVVGGFRLENDERALDGLLPITMLDFLSSSDFWFQSLQNCRASSSPLVRSSFCQSGSVSGARRSPNRVQLLTRAPAKGNDLTVRLDGTPNAILSRSSIAIAKCADAGPTARLQHSFTARMSAHYRCPNGELRAAEGRGTYQRQDGLQEIAWTLWV